jgi:hypothetical protein
LTDFALSRHFFEFPKLHTSAAVVYEFRETIFFLVNSTVGLSTSLSIVLEHLRGVLVF